VAVNSGGTTNGSDLTLTTLTPQPPPTATTTAATGVVTTAAKLNGTVNPNGAATTYHFEYGLTTSYGTSTSDVSAGSGGGNVQADAEISGLNPLHTYHYRIVATNSGGTSYGDDMTLETPLPIELSSFKGSVTVSTGAKLEWTTLSEINDYGFYVQRRGDNDTAFADLKESFVPGHGTSSVVQHYSFCDVKPLSGIVWYRLKQLDLDGSIHFTEAIMLDVTYMVAPKEFALMNNYPNPFNPATTIQFSVAVSGRVTLRVYNSIGEEVATLFDGIAEPGQYYRVTLDGKNLSSGMYVYRLHSADNVSTRRAMLVK
jgi:hypothetical protein